ncbi:MAG TPA: AsmA-like C-terminal region-containing protein [Bacteroidia bacterium]|nr:AsmA-like C-terminal region-containing protein [Bacteroidia bacterium]
MTDASKKKSLVGRLFKWFGIILLILIVLIISAPFLFKKQIVQFVKDTANKELNAKVDFGDFDLSLFRSFPDFSLSIDNVSVANTGEFQGDTLLSSKNISIGLNLMSVIKGDKYEINEISFDQPRIHALVLKNGKANWDITKPSADTSKETPSDSKPFKMGLKKFEIKEGYILYDDASLGFKTELIGMNHNLKGDFSTDVFDIETLLEVAKMNMVYGGVTYMNKVKTRVKATISANMPQFKFIMKENEFSLNELTLGLDGFFAMPKDDMDMDLKFKANQTEFKNILSLIPGVYTADFKDVKTSGKLSLDGYAKGIYNDKKMPAFGCKLLIQDAMFKYPALPKSANNIFVDLKVDNKTGQPDATIIDLNKFHVELGGNPINARMHVSTPVSDANIDGEVKAKIDLTSIKDIIPLEKGDALSGLVSADIKMKGRMSSIDKKEYEKFDARGQLSILDMNYKSASLNYPTTINKLYLNFTPQFVELSQLVAKVGKSDFDMKGKIENFLQYALKDELLKGAFALNSNVIDLNEFMTEDEAAATKKPEEETPMTVIEVPSNLDVKLTANIGKLIYDNLVMTAISGGVGVKDSKVLLDNFKVNTMDGTMAITGEYSTQNVKKPAVDFDLDISNFDITKTFETFNSVKKLAPIGKYAKGKFGTQLKFAANLDEHMEPVLTTLTGGGKLQTKNVVVEGFEPINKLADALKQEKYKRLAFENVNASYKFVNGRVEVDEMPVKVGSIAALVKGSTGFDQTIDYTWKMEIPRAELGSQLNDAANSLLSQANKKAGTDLKLGEKIKLNALFGGTITKPTIKTDLLGSDKTPKEQVKEVITKGVDMAKEKARAEAEKIMKDAQEQADRIKAEAKALADKTKEEGYKAVDQTIESAKNPIAKVAAKAAAPAAKKEVDKKVQKILDEANKKADDILIKAKAESDKKLQ